MSFFFYLTVAASSLAVAAGLNTHTRPTFSDATLSQIRKNAISASNQSWELGTLYQALTLLDAYQLTDLGADVVPVNASAGTVPDEVTSGLDDILAAREKGLKPFMRNGSPADPASIGPAAIAVGTTTGKDKYSNAAASQLDYLLHNVPRDTNNITLSHRQEKFQAWADFMYMAPPFIADSAASVGGDYGASLMWFAHQQALNYRTLLQDPKSKLWRHIAKGDWNDTGLWATGQGWAAMGMLRVEATITKSEYASNMKSERADLRKWTNEILNATWSRQQDSGLVKNYMDQDTFEDAAGTALIAAATYRYSLITETTDYIPFAEKAFTKLIQLVDKKGWLQSVVNPYNFKEVSDRSPEAQSFLIFLHVTSTKFYEWQQDPKRILGTALLKGITLANRGA
ncbi:Six-hairpin glycosidase [Auriculariales sp. MPI-PUGE-AT-0066]|nr:Six-hairpin glycosidase [Auriculariales sp. MPI-PUGE-AT-0066]